MPLYETQVELPCPPEMLFEFLIRPANVVALSPPEMNFTLIDAPEIVSEGSQVRFQVEAFGFKQQMVHEIINLDRPQGFLVREIEGVLKKFEHEHQIFAQAGGNAVLFERVTFEPPGGMVGFLLTEARVREGFEKSFGHRHQKLRQLIERR